MKKPILFYSTIGGAALVLASCGDAQQASQESGSPENEVSAPSTYSISEGSHLKWKGVMLGIKDHEGTISVSSGTLTTENGQVTGGTFTIDMSSIAPLDTNYTEEQTKEKLIGHLSSPDFFDVQSHPTATFTITAVNGTEVTGIMNIRGVEHEETFKNVMITEENGSATITGDITIDRQKYGVAFKMPVADLVISDDINLNVSVNASNI